MDADEVSESSAAVLRSIPIPAWIFDEESLRFVEVNDAALELYGHSREEFLAMTIADIRPAEELDELRRVLATEHGVPMRRGIGRHRTADGTEFDAEVITRAVRWRGRPARLVVAQDVSERADAARVATGLERRLADVFDAITDGVMLIDDDWRVVFLNPAGERLIGELPEPLLGRRLWEAFPEMTGGALHRRLLAAVESGLPDQMEVYWGQGKRWGEAKMFPSTGQLMLYFRDITAEKEAADDAATLIGRLNRLLEISRTVATDLASLDELVDAMPSLVADVLDAETALLYVIDGEHLHLRSAHGPDGTDEGPHVLSRHGSFTGRAIDARRVLTAVDLQNDARASISGRYSHHRATMAAGITTMKGNFGAVVVTDRRPGYFGEADEHTLGLVVETLASAIDRFESIDALQRSEERFRYLSEATTDAAYDWVFGAEAAWFSRGYRDLFGWPAGDQPRALWRDAVHPDDRDGVLAETERAFAAPDVDAFELEYRLARAAGGYASVVDQMFVLRDREGRATRVVGGIVDVTEEVEAEQRSRRAQRLEAVGQLTGGVAHDFNNLLTVILGGVDQLDGLLTGHDGKPWVDMIRDAADRGADLSHRLLAFARQQPLAARATDVDALVDQVASLLHRTLPDHVELHVEHGTGLWPAMVDRSQLENAVLNLCINARDAMPDGGTLTIRTGNVVVPVTLVAGEDEVAGGDYVMIEVVDTGVGIDAELLDRVFEPFFTTKSFGEGTGLGLSMVHGFAMQSSGHVTIESEVDRGTTARLMLPRTADEPEPERPVEPADVERTSAPSGRVLVVEDDLAVQKIVARSLRSRGYDVEVASSGAEAIDVATRSGPFDLLFTDLAMPGGINGLELADRLLEHQPDLEVLYTSGYPEGVLRTDDHAVGGIDLLAKPYRLDELCERVAVAIARRS